MARPEQRKARKDYPQSGIKVGDLYWYVKLKLQRGGMVKRSLTPFKPSQLTKSAFKSGWLAVQEDWEAGDKNGEAMQSVAEALTSIGEEARSAYDNMPEGLQQGDTGQMLDARATGAEEAANSLEGLSGEWEGLTYPGEAHVEPLGDLDDDLQNDEAAEAYESDMEQWQATSDEYDSEVERLIKEADGAISEVPE